MENWVITKPLNSNTIPWLERWRLRKGVEKFSPKAQKLILTHEWNKLWILCCSRSVSSCHQKPALEQLETFTWSQVNRVENFLFSLSARKWRIHYFARIDFWESLKVILWKTRELWKVFDFNTIRGIMQFNALTYLCFISRIVLWERSRNDRPENIKIVLTTSFVFSHFVTGENTKSYVRTTSSHARGRSEEKWIIVSRSNEFWF